MKVIGGALVAAVAGLYWRLETITNTLAEHGLLLQLLMDKLP